MSRCGPHGLAYPRMTTTDAIMKTGTSKSEECPFPSPWPFSDAIVVSDPVRAGLGVLRCPRDAVSVFNPASDLTPKSRSTSGIVCAFLQLWTPRCDNPLQALILKQAAVGPAVRSSVRADCSVLIKDFLSKACISSRLESRPGLGFQLLAGGSAKVCSHVPITYRGLQQEGMAEYSVR